MSTTNTADRLVLIPLASLVESPDNPRGEIDPKDPSIVELAESIKEHGVIEPLIVFPLATGKKHAVIAGHRRRVASKVAGKKEAPCIVRQDLAGDEVEPSSSRKTLMLVENLHREDLTPAQRARGMKELSDLGHSQREIARRVGCTQPTVSKTLAILELPEEIQDMVGEDLPHELVPEALKLRDDPKLALATIKKARLQGYDIGRELAAAGRQHVHSKAVAELREKAKSQGLKVLPEADWNTRKHAYHAVGKTRPNDYHGYAPWLAVDARAHAKEPCHAVVIENERTRDPKLRPVCTDPNRHYKPSSGSEMQVAIEKKPKRTAAEQHDLDRKKGSKIAKARRIEFGPAALKTATRTSDAIELMASDIIDSAGWDVVEAALDLLGVTDHGSQPQAKLHELADTSATERTRVAVALVIAKGHEYAARGYVRWTQPPVIRTYDYLISRGYELDAFEEDELTAAGKAIAEDKAIDAEVDAEAKVKWECRVCLRGEELGDPPNDFTFLDPTICLDCAQAIEDGAIDADSGAVIEPPGPGNNDIGPKAIETSPDDVAEESVTEMLEEAIGDTQEPLPAEDVPVVSGRLQTAPTTAEAVVTIYPKKGRFYRKCSEHGHIEGVSTKVPMAEGRAKTHLDVFHGGVGRIELDERIAAVA